MKFSAENYARKHLLSHTGVEISSRLEKFSSCLVIYGQQPVASSLDAQRFRMMNRWATNFNHKKFPLLH